MPRTNPYFSGPQSGPRGRVCCRPSGSGTSPVVKALGHFACTVSGGQDEQNSTGTSFTYDPAILIPADMYVSIYAVNTAASVSGNASKATAVGPPLSLGLPNQYSLAGQVDLKVYDPADVQIATWYIASGYTGQQYAVLNAGSLIDVQGGLVSGQQIARITSVGYMYDTHGFDYDGYNRSFTWSGDLYLLMAPFA